MHARINFERQQLGSRFGSVDVLVLDRRRVRLGEEVFEVREVVEDFREKASREDGSEVVEVSAREGWVEGRRGGRKGQASVEREKRAWDEGREEVRPTESRFRSLDGQRGFW